jgi:hypothetical protein
MIIEQKSSVVDSPIVNICVVIWLILVEVSASGLDLI